MNKPMRKCPENGVVQLGSQIVHELPIMSIISSKLASHMMRMISTPCKYQRSQDWQAWSKHDFIKETQSTDGTAKCKSVFGDDPRPIRARPRLCILSNLKRWQAAASLRTKGDEAVFKDRLNKAFVHG